MENSLLIEAEPAATTRTAQESRRQQLRSRVVRALTNRRRLLAELIGCSGFFVTLFVSMSGIAFLLTLVPVGGFTDAPAIANTLYASLAYQFPSVRKFLDEVPPPPPPLAASMDLALSPPPPFFNT